MLQACAINTATASAANVRSRMELSRLVIVMNVSGTRVYEVLLIRSQNRDAAAMQAKLDELIRALEGARNQFIGIEHLTEDQLEHIRAKIEKDCDADSDRGIIGTIDSVIRRR